MSLVDLKKALQDTKDEFYKDLTISFSGFNIKQEINRAVYTFLKFYPELKDNIVVFDDDSTDGTDNMLRLMGVRRITWSDKYRDIAKRGEYKHPSYYCSMIVNDIMYQTNTKYLFVSDGDIEFLGRFLERYKFLIREYKVIASIGPEKLTNRIRDKIQRGYLNLVHDDINYYRIWQGHMLLDLEYLKSIGLLYEQLDYHHFTDEIDMDSGAWFAYQIMLRKIPAYELEYYSKEGKRLSPYREANNVFQHKGYISCEKKYGDPRNGWYPDKIGGKA